MVEEETIALTVEEFIGGLNELTSDELRQVANALVTRRAQLDREAMGGLGVGAVVEFMVRKKRNWRLNGLWKGVVTSIKRKRVEVSASNIHTQAMVWRVAPNMLTLVNAKEGSPKKEEEKKPTGLKLKGKPRFTFKEAR